jgi:hypothetical protein
MRYLLVPGTLFICLAAIAQAQDKTPPAPAGPQVTIVLGSRHGHATPVRQGFAHTGGGNIDVAQPAPDTVIVTMSGVAVAGAHPCKDSVAAWNFDLEQCFEVRFDDPKLKQAKLTLEARVIGLLRSHCKGGGVADQAPGCATVLTGPVALVTVCAPPHSVGGGENLSVNCKEGPVGGPVGAGTYTLHQTFAVRATHPHTLAPCKAASAEFAPDPALDPLWISYWEPFHGAAKKDFGLQVTMRVIAETPPNGK